VLPQVNQNTEQARRTFNPNIGVRQGGWVAKGTEDKACQKQNLCLNKV